MKFALCIAALGASSTEVLGFPGLAEKVRQHHNRTWEPVEDADSVFRSADAVKGMLGTIMDPVGDVVPEPHLQSSSMAARDVPATFDARTQWPKCIHPVRTQGECGGCWAFAASEVLSDHLCIASKGATNVVLSVQDVISCDSSDWGCHGGQPKNVWNFLTTTGAAADDCVPYVSGPGKTNGTCSATCPGGGTYKKYKCEHTNFARSADGIKANIMAYGPSHTVMLVYQDLLQYKTGIYKKLEGNLMGPHSVKLVGWGTEKDTEYWIVQNSWGPQWGMGGFFYIDAMDYASSCARGGAYNCGGSDSAIVV